MLLLLFTPLASPTPVDLSCVASVWPGAVTSLYQFSGGASGTIIADGGDDMYDGGNELRLRVNGQWTEPLKYTQICDGALSEPARRGDVEYATCKYATSAALFAAAFFSPAGMIDGFRVGGNLGADGAGHMSTSTTPLRGANNTFGFFKNVFGAGPATRADPSVNHLIIARSEGKVTMGVTTDSDLHEVHFARGVDLVIYMLWSGKSGAQYSEATFQSVLSGVSAACFASIPEHHFTAPPPPKPRPDTSNCARRPCGPTATCADFRQTPCAPCYSRSSTAT